MFKHTDDLYPVNLGSQVQSALFRPQNTVRHLWQIFKLLANVSLTRNMALLFSHFPCGFLVFNLDLPMSVCVTLFEKTCIVPRVWWPVQPRGEPQGPLLGASFSFKASPSCSHEWGVTHSIIEHHAVTVSAYDNLWVILNWHFRSLLLRWNLHTMKCTDRNSFNW